MNGVTGMPASVPPSAGGDAQLSSQETRRTNTDQVRNVETSPYAVKKMAVDQGRLEKLVDEANQSLSSITSLHISLDRDNNRMVVQVVDKANNNRVIRQIPSEDVLELSKRMEALKELSGFLMDTKA